MDKRRYSVRIVRYSVAGVQCDATGARGCSGRALARGTGCAVAYAALSTMERAPLELTTVWYKTMLLIYYTSI